MTLTLGVLVNSTQAAYTPAQGDIIKTATDSAVYYIGSDGKRHLYVNEVTFWTWYDGDWSNIMENGVKKTVQTISQAEFESIELGKNATVKPGSKLIKFQNSPKAYDVVSSGKLAEVPHHTAADLLLGIDWGDQIITIQNGFETDYTKDGVLDVTAYWKHYDHPTADLSFDYPQYWPNPQLHTDELLTGGYPAEKSSWRITINDRVIYAHTPKDYATVLSDLQSSDVITNIEEKVINGNQVIQYRSAGMHINMEALIFGSEHTYLLESPGDMGDDQHFKYILGSIEL